MFEPLRKVGAGGPDPDARTSAQIVRFGAVGVLSNLTYFAVLGLACKVAELPLWLAGAVAYALSMVLNYLLQRRVTFRSERPHAEALLPYLLVQGASLSVNSALLWLLVTKLDLPFLVGQAVALIATTTLNFVCQRGWVFRHRPAQGHSA